MASDTTMRRTTDFSSVRRRKRAMLACQACHLRKVRCNVTQSGPPCINCAGDGVSCELVARGRGGRRHRLVDIVAQKSQDTAAPIQPNQEENRLSLVPCEFSALPSSSHAPPTSESEFQPCQVVDGERLMTAASTTDSPTVRSHGRQNDAEPRDVDTGFDCILDDGDGEEATACVYTGDQQGLGLVVDICKPNRNFRGNHFMVPRDAVASPLVSEDSAVLHAKECFSLPSKRVRDQLLRSYFHYVHPFLPILDASAFFRQYESGPRNVSLLLLWSMFFASINFLDKESLSLAGYTSRKAMKRSLYRRAKALYDADYEKDKISLIQSVLLLAFWYADSEDRDGSWHWVGIGISLCQTIGLHRSPLNERAGLGRNFIQRKKTFSDDRCRLWRLIWWMYYFRDTWLSFGMGRPTRINLNDCDTPIPTPSDVEALCTGLSRQQEEKYFPKDPKHMLPRVWACLLDTTFALGAVLNHHYRAKPLELDPSTAFALDENQLRQCRAGFPTEEACQGPVVLLHLYHLHVYYEACVIALHRPYMVERPGTHVTPSEAWKVEALQKAKIAASNINSTLNKISAAQMISSCHSMMVTAMIPALQVHLLQSISEDPFAKCLARNHLNICMIMLKELRQTYWAADFIHSLFSKARKQIDALKTPQQDLVPSRDQGSSEQETPMTPPSVASFMNVNSIRAATSRTSLPASASLHPIQDNSFENNVPLDVDLALSYDIFPFQFDHFSIDGDLENPAFHSPSSRHVIGEGAPSFELSDADVSVFLGNEDPSQRR